MSVATWMLGGDRATSRQALSLSLSLLLHLTFGVVAFLLAQRERPEPPIEVAIFEGPRGPSSPPPGEPSVAPGPVGSAPEEAQAAEAPTAPPTPKVKVAQPRRPAPKPAAPVERPVEEPRRLAAALGKTGLAPTTQAFEGVESSVQPRNAPSESEAPTGMSGTARSNAAVAGGPAVTGSAGSVLLPGPGGGGAGAGGGIGRGGFSVSGAGAGGTSRSYAAIWEWTQRYLVGFRWAYDDHLRVTPTLRGLMVVRYQISSSGSVGDVTLVSSQIQNPQLEQAILHQILGWRYPPEPSGTVVVTWPFSFLPPS